jgi:uncharacterized protein with GYD domain
VSLYLARFGYTPEAWAALIEEPQNREEAVRPIFEKAGCVLHGLWYAFGEDDGFVLYDAPSAATAAAISLAVASSKAFRSFETTPLMSVDEMIEALHMAGTLGYRAPTAAHVTA